MTIREMQKSVLQQLKKIDPTLSGEIVHSEDVELYLNKAIDKFVDDRLEPRNNPQGLGFEQSVTRIDDLRTLIKESVAISTSNLELPFSNEYFLDAGDLPADYDHLLYVSAKIEYNKSGVTFTVVNDKREVVGVENTDYAVKNVKCKFVQIDDLQVSLGDPFNTTKISSPKYTVNGDKIYVYSNTKFIVEDIYVSYIRQPAKVSLADQVDCDLATSTHEEIVDIAVQLIAQDRGVIAASREPNGS